MRLACIGSRLYLERLLSVLIAIECRVKSNRLWDQPCLTSHHRGEGLCQMLALLVCSPLILQLLTATPLLATACMHAASSKQTLQLINLLSTMPACIRQMICQEGTSSCLLQMMTAGKQVSANPQAASAAHMSCIRLQTITSCISLGRLQF